MYHLRILRLVRARIIRSVPRSASSRSEFLDTHKLLLHKILSLLFTTTYQTNKMSHGVLGFWGFMCLVLFGTYSVANRTLIDFFCLVPQN